MAASVVCAAVGLHLLPELGLEQFDNIALIVLVRLLLDNSLAFSGSGIMLAKQVIKT